MTNRVFIKHGDELGYFMWLDIKPEGDVIMGFSWNGAESLEAIFDEEPVEAKDLIHLPGTHPSKISFHKTGLYKLSSRVGKDSNSIDRITVTGPPLCEITEPRRMAELLLPSRLLVRGKAPREKDVIIDLSNMPCPPTRCSIVCLPISHKNALLKQLIDTSEWEAVNAFENDTHLWVWIFRKSRGDTEHSEKVFVYLPGNPRWGKTYVDV